MVLDVSWSELCVKRGSLSLLKTVSVRFCVLSDMCVGYAFEFKDVIRFSFIDNLTSQRSA